MHRVLGRQRGLKFDQFLGRLQRAEVSHQSHSACQNFPFAKKQWCPMEFSALKILAGNARLPGPVLGRRGTRASAKAPSEGNVVPRRSLREPGKLISHKPRRSSSRIESSRDLSAQRLLECAVDVLRNVSEKVNSLRSRWGGENNEPLDLSVPPAEEKQNQVSGEAPKISLEEDRAEQKGNLLENVVVVQEAPAATTSETLGSLDNLENAAAEAEFSNQGSGVIGEERAEHFGQFFKAEVVEEDVVLSENQTTSASISESDSVFHDERPAQESGAEYIENLKEHENGTTTGIKKGDSTVAYSADTSTLQSGVIEERPIQDFFVDYFEDPWKERETDGATITGVEPAAASIPDTLADSTIVGSGAIEEVRPILEPVSEYIEGHSKEQGTNGTAIPEKELSSASLADSISSAHSNSLIGGEIQEEVLLQAFLSEPFEEPCNKHEAGRVIQVEVPIQELISEHFEEPFYKHEAGRVIQEEVPIQELISEHFEGPLNKQDAGRVIQEEVPIQELISEHFEEPSSKQEAGRVIPEDVPFQELISEHFEEPLSKQEAGDSIVTNEKDPTAASIAEAGPLVDTTSVESAFSDDAKLTQESSSDELRESLKQQGAGSSRVSRKELVFPTLASDFAFSVHRTIQEDGVSEDKGPILDSVSEYVEALKEQETVVEEITATSEKEILEGAVSEEQHIEERVLEYIETAAQQQAVDSTLPSESPISAASVTNFVGGNVAEEELSSEYPEVPVSELETAASTLIGERQVIAASDTYSVLSEGPFSEDERPIQEPVSDLVEPLQEQETGDSSANSKGQINGLAVADFEISAQTNSVDMDKQGLGETVKRLRSSIAHHAYMYNTLDNPTISDAAYDGLVEELAKLEFDRSYPAPMSTPMVGAEPAPEMLKVKHSVPMLSLASVLKEEDVFSWQERLHLKLGTFCGTVGWVVEPKVDGLALTLWYENGKLVYAATRGNGIQGEDVTHNALGILGIPSTFNPQLPGTKNALSLLEVRGEIFMSLKQFKELNAQMIQAGEKSMANPRNAAAGSMRLLAESSSNLRPLSFMAYSILTIEVSLASKKGPLKKSASIPKTQWESLQLLESIGFVVNKDNAMFEEFDSALEYARSWRDTRPNLEYEADGVVFKVNSLAIQASLGITGNDPRWALAWKFAATEAVTVLEGIVLTIGRSGAIIPNACLKPVELGGVTISRASLHNIGHVKALGLCEGDYIVVQRAGDVIPQVVQVLEELRLETAKPWSPPQDCPSCGSKLTEISASTMVFCSNLNCESRHSRQVVHFARTLISGLGTGTLSLLQEEGLVADPLDFYKLDAKALSNLKGFGKLSIAKVLKAIEESKRKDLWLFFAAVGIPRVGATTAKVLADYFGSLQALLKASLSDLVVVSGIGESTARVIFDWCQSEPNIELVQGLEEVGCDIKRHTERDDAAESVPSSIRESVDVKNTKEVIDIVCDENSGGVKDVDDGIVPDGKPALPSLQGKIVVITGDFGKMLREDMKKLVTSHGATTRTSVTSKTSFVLAGNRPGPTKIAAAKEREVEIINLETFHKLIGNFDTPA